MCVFLLHGVDVMGFTHFANVEDVKAQLILMFQDKHRNTVMDNNILDKHGWAVAFDGHSADKTYHFSSFSTAIAWMASLVNQIDALNHHPEWQNVYNRVEVRLTTHDAGTLTELDIQLADVLDQSFDLMQG
jgi:4a-hydroxytetrahydrobiopterin dehydratase